MSEGQRTQAKKHKALLHVVTKAMATSMYYIPKKKEGGVSDSVTDVVMSSLLTCNMNYGYCWEGRGRVREQGVGSRSPTRDKCG
jgi:hypothetical protein